MNWLPVECDGYVISDQTVGNVLRRYGRPPAPERKRTTTWPDFIRTHLALLTGTDFVVADHQGGEHQR